MKLLYAVFLLCLFVVCVPVIILVALVLVCTSGFPILFRQKRVGKNGKPFMMYKFRTMVINAEKLQQKLIRKNESDGPTFKIANDPRFTPLGKFLSHTGLDELPQLYNVLRGEMALIGPRPLPVSEAKKLKVWMRARQNLLPGIISPAILTGTYHKNFDAWMRNDIAYVKKKNMLTDIRLVGQSILFLFRLLITEVRR